MSSRPPTDATGSTTSRPASPPSPEEALTGSAPPSDDVPTIISKKSPVVTMPFDGRPANIRGLRLAHFELIEPIGVGGMAAVLRARDTQLDRLVALKILPQEMAADPENILRFHQEARSAARLDHENIARVFFCGEDQGLHFIAFEFVEGQNLRALIARRGRLQVPEALNLLVQVAAGLSHAAQRGVVHRDIKPSNIIVQPNGRAKLVDMGLARCLGARSDQDLTQSGVTLGTFDYISPEQALEPRDADVRSDIYSLGCTFYHALTGRPPVPEGTAAKKLHHHQHIAPPDPRQFAPALPVEVVRLLSRMMAKSPRDRFQTAEDLVHHALQTARKLGAVPDVPEGALTIEATLPTPPGGRPLVWAALAAAAVVGLVLLLDQAPGSGLPSGAPAARLPANGAEGPLTRVGPDKRGPEERSNGHEASAPAPDAVYVQKADHTADDLRAWLEQHREAARIELRLSSDLALNARGPKGVPGLVVEARERVVIKAVAGRPTLRFTYDADWSGSSFAALTVRAREVQIEGVRFVVDATLSEVDLAALVLEGGRQHLVRGCEFIQAQPSLAANGRRVASVRLTAARAQPIVALRDCAFLGFGKWTRPANRAGEQTDLSGLASVETGGRDAVVRQGAVRLKADHCVFGPHESVFRFEGAPPEESGSTTVQQCSVLLAPRRSAAFDFSGAARGALAVSHSLFARLAGPAEDGAVLIRQADDDASGITYQGQGNRYHDLDGYWAVGGAWEMAGWDELKRRPSEQVSDTSRVALSWPWRAEPARQVELLSARSLGAAFAVSLEQVALRQGPTSTRLVGAASILGEPWYKDVPPLTEKDEPALPRQLVVESAERDDSLNGVYKSLALAVGSARPGDVIVLRHTGELATDVVQLNSKGLSKLTIKPARKFRPTLVLSATDLDAALFRVHDGWLRLEGLDLKLGAKKDFRSQAVIALVGDGEVILKDCTVTLKRDGDTHLALATLLDPGKIMKPEMQPVRTRDQGPRLALEGCLVRGEGDLLAAKISRPVALALKGSLVALSGSLLNAEVQGDGKAPPEEQGMVLSLNQLTTYLGAPLVRIGVTKGPQGLVPVKCDAHKCLFAPAATAKVLIALEGSDIEDKSLRGKFAWTGEQNGYGAYSSFLTESTADEMPVPMNAEKWKMQMKEEGSDYGVKLRAAPPTETAFADMLPSQFKLPESAAQGADLSKVAQPAR